MKKRACKTSVNYDEFKNKVLSASLKPLDRKEIDTLKDVKKGWMQKTKSNDIEISNENISDLAILTNAKHDNAIKPNKASNFALNTTKKKKPKNISEMERDFKRLQCSNDKLRLVLDYSML